MTALPEYVIRYARYGGEYETDETFPSVEAALAEAKRMAEGDEFYPFAVVCGEVVVYRRGLDTGHEWRGASPTPEEER